MAERSTLKPVSASSVPSLAPQGEQAGKPAMPLGRPFTLIGSRNRAHLHLLSSSISRNHASLISTDTGLYLRDLSSRTGVLVNGRKVKESDLRDGDIVQVGSFRFRFTDPSGASRLGITPRPAAAMLEMDGATLTPIDTRTILIGRRPTCDIALPEASVSNTHCLIFEINGHRFIRDLGSRTGTLVNGKPVHHQQLEFGDEIRVGDTEFRFLSAAPAPQPLELDAADLDADDEPIGLAFDQGQQPAHVARVEAIPEADAHDLLPEQEEVEPPLEPIALTPEAGEFSEPAAPVEPPHAEADDPDIDFEIAGSQLDLQNKLAETSRLAARDDKPPAQGLTASDDSLRPAEDLGLDFLDEEFSAPAQEQEQRVEEQPEAQPGLTTDELAAAEPDVATWASEPAVESDATPIESETTDAESEPAGGQAEAPAPQPESQAQEPQAQEAHEAHLEPEVEPSPEAAEQSEAPAAAAPEPIAVDQIDLSSVNFRDESPVAADETNSASAEEVAEVQADPRPLLDLAPQGPAAEPEPHVESPESGAEVPTEQDDASAPAVEPPEPETESTAETETEAPPTPPATRYRKPSRRSRRKRVSDAPVDAPVDVPIDAPALAEPSLASQADSVEAAAGELAVTASSVQLPEPSAEQNSSTSDAGDVIASSEPTPESAQELGEAIEQTAPAAGAEAPSAEATAVDPLTDTAFGRIVEEFAGPESPALIEEPAAAEAESVCEPVAEIELASEEPLENASPAADAQATTPDEPFTEVPPAPIAESVTAALSITDEAVDFIADEPARHEVTSDVSIDDVVELDSTALLDEESPATTPGAPEPIGLELADEPLPPAHEAPTDSEDAARFAPSDTSLETNALGLPPAPPQSIDPFFGMERDLGSFVGGHPLALSSAPLIETPFAQSRVIAEPEQPAVPAQSPVPSRPAPAEPPRAVVQPPAEIQPVPVEPAPAEAAQSGQQAEPGLDFDEFPSLSEDLANVSDEPTGASAWVGSEPSAESVSSHVAPQADEVAGLDDLADLDSLDAPEKLDFSAEPAPLPPIDDLLADDDQPLELFDGTADKLDEIPDVLDAIGDVSGVLAEEPAPRAEAQPQQPAAAPRAAEPVARQAPAKPPEKPAPPAPPPSSAKPRVKPPPPPKTSPLRASSLSQAFDFAAGEVPIPDQPLPSFAGQQAPGRGRAPSFDGLAAPPVREADVFSHEAFGALDDVFFGSPSANPEIPPTAKPGVQRPASPEAAAQSPSAPTSPAQRKPRDRNRDRIPPNRQALPRQGQPLPARPLATPARPVAAPPSGAAPPPPDAPPSATKRVPWWKKVRTLLPLMILCLAGAWAGILLGIPQKHAVEGTLRFDGMEGYAPPQERERAESVRQLLRKPDIRQAVENNAKNSGAAGGFLDDPAAMDNLSHADFEQPDHSEFSEARKALVLVHSSTRPDLDRVRMKAILSVLYQEDGARRDTASTAQRDLQAAQAKVADLQRQRDLASAKLQDLESQARALGAPSDDQLKGPALWADQLDRNDKDLWAAWQKAIARQAEAQAALDRAQTAAPEAPAAPVNVGEQRRTGSPNSAAPADADPQIRRLQASIDSLTTRLHDAQESGTGSGAQASQALDAALARVGDQLALVGDPSDPGVEAYVASARSTRDEVRQLLKRIESETRTARQLQEQISQAVVARQDSDPALRDLLRDRDMYEHRYEAASGSGLAADAAKIKGVLDGLDQKIEARRQTLNVGAAAATDHSPAGESLKQLQADRQRDAQRMRDRVDHLDSSAPAAQGIPAELQPRAQELVKRVSGLAAAGERYASAVAGGPADGAREVASIQSQLAAAQEQIERQRKALADAAARQWSRQQQQARAAAVSAAGKTLAQATADADKAASDYASNRKLLSTVRELADQKMAFTEIDQKLQIADQDLAQQKGRADRVATLAAPDDNSVIVTYGKDNRLSALAGVSVVIVLFFGGLMWFGSSPAQPHDVPFAHAVAIAHDVPGHHADDFAADDAFGQDDREPIVA